MCEKKNSAMKEKTMGEIEKNEGPMRGKLENFKGEEIVINKVMSALTLAILNS